MIVQEIILKGVGMTEESGDLQWAHSNTLWGTVCLVLAG